jgi:hypothetical protein
MRQRGRAAVPRGRLHGSGALAARIRTAADRLFAADDALAQQHGWQVEVGRVGLSRKYRDPRFDGLARKPAADDAETAGLSDRNAALVPEHEGRRVR